MGVSMKARTFSIPLCAAGNRSLDRLLFGDPHQQRRVPQSLGGVKIP